MLLVSLNEVFRDIERGPIESYHVADMSIKASTNILREVAYVRQKQREVQPIPPWQC